MKKVSKLFTVGVGAVFALTALAGCGGENENDVPTPDLTVTPFSDQAVTLTVDGAGGRTVSDSLFGVFLEDINYAGYLLDDNLLVNGSFETFDQNQTFGWKTDNASVSVNKSGNGVLSGEAEYGAKGVNAKYATITLSAANGGLVSSGHAQLPIAVQSGKGYLFSAFVRASGGNMTVKILDGSTTLAESTVALKTDGWVKYQSTLTVNADCDNASFAILFDAAGNYDVDGIQLETPDSTVGIKQYVYDAVKELAPKFIRFPGGCIIEGDGGNGGADTKEVYDWKNSVGAVQNGVNAGDDTIPAFTYTLVKDGEESTQTTYGEWIVRQQNGDLWGYDMEYGVGFYEFFQLCESLGAGAVPVVNCGLSDQGGAATNPTALNGRHGKKVEDYIQDAIDLIEFAKGGTDTKWGKLREQLGHPAPFKMDYIGIGNEQFGTYYALYYNVFLKSEAFRDALAQYKVKPIVGNAMTIGDCENPETGKKGMAQTQAELAVNDYLVDAVCDYGVHDQHYYVNWTKLLEHTGMYDWYKRPENDPYDYYEVFVGEYSANDGDGRVTGYPLYPNSLITALSEAAMMTSYERNGDIIKLAAYAPMFGVANKGAGAITGGADGANQWDVDMMYYTNTKIVRTANYYVQKMFMNNQGAQALVQSKLDWKTSDSFLFASESAGAEDKEFQKIYYIASKAENGDLIVKAVNLSGGAIKMNVGFANAASKGFAYVTELSNEDYKALNTFHDTAVEPVSSSIGWEGQSFGYELKPYSLTVFRILAK